MHDLTATLSHSDHNLFRSDVVEGLSRLQKTIPCRWLYDERGSDLFEEITRLEDYYPTRAETAILRARQPELQQFAGPGPILIEYGAGAGVKTELVLASAVLWRLTILWSAIPRYRCRGNEGDIRRRL